MTAKLSATVMVSGCFDLLHSGHIAFLEAAAELGDLLVAIGSDETVRQLKGQPPVCSEAERLYHVRALRCVREAFISRGSGALDFEAELRARHPTIFVVNEDGDSHSKRELCRELGINYQVLNRRPALGLPARSTTLLRQEHWLPYRIDLAGGWLDQPRVSQFHPGAVIVASLISAEPLQPRSGLASSTRESALRLWGTKLPPGDPLERARQLFACENPPGTVEVSGSQDALGIVLPGISRLFYDGGYWPAEIHRITDADTLAWLESRLFLQWIGPRPERLVLWRDATLTRAKVEALVRAADDCWQAIERRDNAGLARSIVMTFRAQTAIFPAMTNDVVARAVNELQGGGAAAKLAGAGGAGYLIVAADACPAGAFPIRIRRLEMDSL